MQKILFPPPRYLSLTAIMKNEASYLAQWLEYYILMGIEHFYLYDNGSDDGTVEIAQSYVERGFVTLHHCPGVKKQMFAYCDALKKYREHTRWMVFCDLDEYILPKQRTSIMALVREYDKCDQILVRWLNFGDSGYITKPDGLTVEKFLYREVSNCHLKPILKTESVLHFFNMHIAMTTGVSYTLPYDEAQCNHYVVRSFEEYMCKKTMRNREQPGTTTGGNVGYEREFFHAHNDNTVYDDSMLRFVPSLKRILTGC